jgi:tetratricopeptide (TPR) repeat protein
LDTPINVFGSISDAAWYFYNAAKLGEKILTAESAIVYSCVGHFLKYVATLKISSGTEITTVHTQEKINVVEWYAEMVQLAIRIDQHKHGYSSSEVVNWYKALAKLYIDSKQEERVIDIYKELYAATVAKHGSQSEEAKLIYRYFVTLDIVFNDPSINRVGELEELIFGIGKEFTDYLCIKNWLWLANTFEQCKHFFEAERLYVSLLQSITIICDGDADVDASSIKIDIALEYVKFLRRQGRVKDASSILVCLAAEYKEDKEYHKHSINGETEKNKAVVKYITRIRDVAEECRAHGLSSIAVSILRNVWNSFSSKGYSKETQSTAILITEVIQEITETTETTTTIVTTKTTTVTESTEKAVRELFEHLVHQHHHDTSDTTLFSASKALISVYTQQKNWRLVEETLKKTLDSTWKEILTAGSKIKLPQYSTGECLDLARRLAACYSTQGLFSMAEEVHSQVFAACSTLKLEDSVSTKSGSITGAELYETATNSLIAFYEEHHRHTEAINIHIKVLEKYEAELGTKHASTIKILYLLADRYLALGHEEAYIYYDKIVSVLNEGHDYCHHHAFRAALVLSKHYDARSFWDKLHAICNVLWVTITRNHEEHVTEEGYRIDAEAIALIYDRYSYVLDHHAKADFSKRYDVAVKYRDIITKSSSDETLVIKTLIALAKICETHKDYYKVSVSAYEEVLKRIATSTTITTVTTVETVKKRLSKMYVVMVEESQTTEFDSERAIAITLEAYHKHRDEFRTDPDQTLVYLKNVIFIYQKLDVHERIYQFLEEAIKHILTVATLNIELLHVAHEFAMLFAATGLTQKGKDLLHKMRKSITHGHKHSHKDAQLDHESQTKKVVFTFLIVFAHGLEQPHEKLSYSKVMTENVLEFLLLEKYSQKVKEEAKFEVILEYGAKLRHFWRIHHRHEFIKDLDEELIKRFKASFSQHFDEKVSDEMIAFFYAYLIEELGEDRPSLNFDFDTFMLQIGNELVKGLLDKNEFDKANQISLFIFSFAKERKLYHHVGRIRYGCMLAQYLVGIDASHPDDVVHSEALLQTSLAIMANVIDAINSLDIAFETLPAEDLIGLVHLLYRQSNYKQLERVLSPLWNMRSDLPSVFDSELPTIAEIGTCLVHAQCAQSRWSAAIETVRELYYNLQRGLGRLHTETLAVSQLFSNILVTIASGGDSGYASYAMDLHEAVLTEICRHSEVIYNGYTRRDIQFLSKTAELHLKLLKKLHSQFKDSGLEDMNKRENTLDELSNKLQADLIFDGTTGDLLWQYTVPKTWKFGELDEERNGVNVLETSKREWVLASRIFY